MPAHDSLGPGDAHGIKNARVATIELDEQGAVDPTQMQSTARRALLQDIELMPQYQDFGLQPCPRLEEVAQHTNEQGPIAIIRRSCSDSSVTDRKSVV